MIRQKYLNVIINEGREGLSFKKSRQEGNMTLNLIRKKGDFVKILWSVSLRRQVEVLLVVDDDKVFKAVKQVTKPVDKDFSEDNI